MNRDVLASMIVIAFTAWIAIPVIVAVLVDDGAPAVR